MATGTRKKTTQKKKTTGTTASKAFFGIFGLMAYVFPICFFLAVVFAVSNRENKVAAVKIVAAVLFVSFLCLFVQMVTDSSKESADY